MKLNQVETGDAGSTKGTETQAETQVFRNFGVIRLPL